MLGVHKLIIIGCMLTVFVNIVNTRDYMKNDEEINAIINKIADMLQERENEKIPEYYPQFLEMLVKLWKLKQGNLKLQQQDYEDAESIQDYNQNIYNDPSSAQFPSNTPSVNIKLLESMLNKEEIKSKRGYHRALCHFKICNMGTKRNGYWNTLKNYEDEQK